MSQHDSLCGHQKYSDRKSDLTSKQSFSQSLSIALELAQRKNLYDRKFIEHESAEISTIFQLRCVRSVLINTRVIRERVSKGNKFLII